MLPIRLETRRYTGGHTFGLSDAPDVLIADPLQSEQLTIETTNLEDPVFLRLINASTDADLARFAERFYDSSVVALPELREEAKGLYSAALHSFGKGLDTLRRGPEKITSNRVNEVLSEATLKPIMRRVDGKPRLVLLASSTSDFMALEIAIAFEQGARMSTCAHCQKNMLYGPLTGRRSHARYCADRCRVAAMRARNATKGGTK